MERKNTLNIVVLVLVVALIGVAAWAIRTQKELSSLQESYAALSQSGNSLAVCDDTSTPEKETACIGRLTQLSSELVKYQTKLQNK